MACELYLNKNQAPVLIHCSDESIQAHGHLLGFLLSQLSQASRCS